MNGLATLPSVTNALISADTTGKAVVTKEYLNLQKIITYPADFTGTNYTLTNADMGYSIIIVNGAPQVAYPDECVDVCLNVYSSSLPIGHFVTSC